MNGGWIFGFFIGVLGIIAHFTYIPWASEYNYWLLLAGFLMVSINSRFYRY